MTESSTESSRYQVWIVKRWCYSKFQLTGPDTVKVWGPKSWCNVEVRGTETATAVGIYAYSSETHTDAFTHFPSPPSLHDWTNQQPPWCSDSAVFTILALLCLQRRAHRFSLYVFRVTWLRTNTNLLHAARHVTAMLCSFIIRECNPVAIFSIPDSVFRNF